MADPARSLQQRINDTLHRLQHDVDAWVATAHPARGEPYLVPLSFLWDGSTILMATPASSPTGRNLAATGRVRIGLGPTRDVVLIDGIVVETVAAGEIAPDIGNAFAATTGFDPRDLVTPYRYVRIQPRRVQAWREVNELDDRDLMRDATWIAAD